MLLQHFESSNSSQFQDGNSHSLPTKEINNLYCLSGHKMSVGTLPPYVKQNNHRTVPGEYGSSNYSHRYPKDLIEQGAEFRLNQVYFADRHNSKITKSRLHISSAAMLPLRRLLLVGADDGTVKVIS